MIAQLEIGIAEIAAVLTTLVGAIAGLWLQHLAMVKRLEDEAQKRTEEQRQAAVAMAELVREHNELVLDIRIKQTETDATRVALLRQILERMDMRDNQ